MKLHVIALAVLAVGVITVLGCGGVPENETTNPTANFAQVSGGVYRGARPDRAALEQLAKMGVRTILNLEDADDAIEQERVWAEELGLKQVVTRMTGRENPNDAGVAQALAVLADTQSHPVFVHCMKGQDRTGVILALHRVFNEGWSARDAEREMMSLGYNSLLITMRDYFELKAGLD